MGFSYKRYEVTLKKSKAKPFWFHHPWVFSGAIKDIKGSPSNGDIVQVFDEQRNFIGKGFINFNSQIRVRLLAWDIHDKIGKIFFENKIHQAISLRENVLKLSSKTNAYRLIHGEGDGLSGLIVDRYDSTLVVQFNALGMDKRKEMILDILRKKLTPKTIVERYSAGYRKLEGLEEIDFAILHGSKPPQSIQIREYGLRFQVDVTKGQKTGYYLDQRENRLYASQFGYKKRVLDAFCYTGGFGIYMASKGNANEVLFLDSSPHALKFAENNAGLNKGNQNTFTRADIFKYLPKLQQQQEVFDIIVLDPPKVAPGKGSVKSGLMALEKINATAMAMLPPNGGILITCDCSGDISLREFVITLNKAAIEARRSIHIFHSAGAGPDHPINPACLENSYLKTLFISVY